MSPPLVEQPLATAIAFAPGATCLDATRVEAQVEAWLGRDRIAGDVRIEVKGSDRDPHALVFRIVRQGRAHERRFDHLPEGCDDATAVVGLGIALAIDASVASGIFAPPPPAAAAQAVRIDRGGGRDGGPPGDLL
ncbi:MAG: hypothetical protein ACRENE_00185, partial [Polyangiaceae bacterium]